MTLTIISTAALLDQVGRVLICQRPNRGAEAGRWEFPGGKVEAEETPLQALIRELDEEIGVRVQKNCIAPCTFVESSLASDQELLILLYVIRVFDGQPQPRLQQPMQWVYPHRLGDFPMPAPNQHLIAMLRDLL